MKVKVKERVNWPITILLILGLVTVIFPLYLTVVIAFKKPSEMTNSISGILSAGIAAVFIFLPCANLVNSIISVKIG